MQSALERELNSLATRVRIMLRGHDRGIILAFLLCLAPLPPVMLIGALLMLIHALLLALGRLDRREATPIVIGILVAAAYTWLWVHIAVIIEHAGPLHALHQMFDHLFGINAAGQQSGFDKVAYGIKERRQ